VGDQYQTNSNMMVCSVSAHFGFNGWEMGSWIANKPAREPWIADRGFQDLPLLMIHLRR
jgi:hypothetical protein